MSPAIWVPLLGQLLVLSFLQIGGGLVIAPDVQRLLVDKYHLLTPAQFTAAIAIAQSAPGPNALWAAVAGFQAAGVTGAIAVVGAILTPSSVVAVAMGRLDQARGQGRALQAFKAGMAPITVALICSIAWLLLGDAPSKLLVGDAPSIGRLLVAAVTTVVVWRTRIHILWLISFGALVGALGWL